MNRLNLPGSLRRFLSSRNLIDSTGPSVRQRTRRATHWREVSTALGGGRFSGHREALSADHGHEHRWMLNAILDNPAEQKELAKQRRPAEPESHAEPPSTIGCLQ